MCQSILTNNTGRKAIRVLNKRERFDPYNFKSTVFLRRFSLLPFQIGGTYKHVSFFNNKNSNIKLAYWIIFPTDFNFFLTDLYS